jgi:hypothetical protein
MDIKVIIWYIGDFLPHPPTLNQACPRCEGHAPGRRGVIDGRTASERVSAPPTVGDGYMGYMGNM